MSGGLVAPGWDPEPLRAVLRGNDRGSHTIPAAGLYPHQWNWDSALIAVGWATFDVPRAWRELTSLLAAQDPRDGLVAHIAFDPAATSYNPGPAWWSGRQGGDGRLISDITQPPVAATCARVIAERTGDAEPARPLLEPLQRWHDFLVDVRGGGGEPVLVHPWESGRDNSVEWDVPLTAVPPSERVPERRDHAFVAEEQRPPAKDYARYYGLLESFQALGWDQAVMARQSPFRMLDPAFSSMLCAAAADLAWLAERLGERAIARRAGHHAELLEAALRSRADADGIARPRSAVTGDDDRAVTTVALALQVLRPALPAEAARRLRDLLCGPLDSPFGVRSTSRDSAGHEPANYWRGPVWTNVTWLCALGLERHGEKALATDLRDRISQRRWTGACPEYLHPESGEGLGARDFSWTAALTLDARSRLPR